MEMDTLIHTADCEHTYSLWEDYDLTQTSQSTAIYLQLRATTTIPLHTCISGHRNSTIQLLSLLDQLLLGDILILHKYSIL